MTSKSSSRPTTRQSSTASTFMTKSSGYSSWIGTRTVIPASVAWIRRSQVAGQLPVSLSEAFMRGYIGGLPKNF